MALLSLQNALGHGYPFIAERPVNTVRFDVFAPVITDKTE
jgi:hypothetical protein